MKIFPLLPALALLLGGCVTEPAPDEPIQYGHIDSPKKKHWWQSSKPKSVTAEEDETTTTTVVQ